MLILEFFIPEFFYFQKIYYLCNINNKILLIMLYNIKQEYQCQKQEIYEIWGKYSSYKYKSCIEHKKLLNVCKSINFLNDIETFDTIDDFILYINNILISNNIETDEYKDINNQFKGYIFELFTYYFLNYFSTISVHVRNKEQVETYIIKYVCRIPDNYEDYGIDLLCKITSRTGESKNAVIQVKYRSDVSFENLHSIIIDKLGFQGARAGFIKPLTPENSDDKTLILFTSAKYDKFKRTFEEHIGFKNLLIIDGNTINDLINNTDFWEDFKQFIINIIKYNNV